MKSKVFGRPLIQVIEKQTEEVPIVRACVNFLYEHGKYQFLYKTYEIGAVEGIFRLSVASKHLDYIKSLVNAGKKVKFTEPLDAACVLKLFFRELPEVSVAFSSKC